MILRWIQSLFGRPPVEQATAQGGVDEARCRELKRERDEQWQRTAASDSQRLKGLVREGETLQQKKVLKQKVRQKVWEIIEETYDGPDPEMVDEITESLVEAAEADPYYQRLLKSADKENH